MRRNRDVRRRLPVLHPRGRRRRMMGTLLFSVFLIVFGLMLILPSIHIRKGK